ncbi:hypothetical protein GCM10028820_01450 [Tessaracoccus terricola]
MIIGVAAVVLAGLVVWGLVGGGDTEPTTTPTESVTTVQSTEGTDGTTGPTEQTTGPGEETTEPTGETSEPTDVDWGPVTPPNVDSLRDFFTAPNFPDSIGPFVQDPEGPIKDVASITVDYDDNEAIRGVGVVISMGRDSYTLATSEMPDATVMGNAVCGTTNDGIGDIIQCLVAGEPATLKVLTAGVDHMTLEELAEFTNSLYDQL